jgi:hypothetical protein
VIRVHHTSLIPSAIHLLKELCKCVGFYSENKTDLLLSFVSVARMEAVGSLQVPGTSTVLGTSIHTQLAQVVIEKSFLSKKRFMNLNIRNNLCGTVKFNKNTAIQLKIFPWLNNKQHLTKISLYQSPQLCFLIPEVNSRSPMTN